MTDATTYLEEAYAEAATVPLWYNVAWRGACTSFRDRDVALEYIARIKIRWGANLTLWASEHIPGYEPADD